MHARVWVLILVASGAGVLAASPKKSPPKKVVSVVADAGPADAGVDAGPVNNDPCARLQTCNGCVTHMTASCGTYPGHVTRR